MGLSSVHPGLLVSISLHPHCSLPKWSLAFWRRSQGKGWEGGVLLGCCLCVCQVGLRGHSSAHQYDPPSPESPQGASCFWVGNLSITSWRCECSSGGVGVRDGGSTTAGCASSGLIALARGTLSCTSAALAEHLHGC
jgi:hypothetical protein